MNLERKIYGTRSEKVADFFIGVLVCIGLNGILSFVITFGAGAMYGIVAEMNNDLALTVVNILCAILYTLPCLIQIGLVIYFGLTRYWIALGMLGTIAFGLLLSLVLVAACFVLIAGLSGGFGN